MLSDRLETQGPSSSHITSWQKFPRKLRNQRPEEALSGWQQSGPRGIASPRTLVRPFFCTDQVLIQTPAASKAQLSSAGSSFWRGH